MRLVDIFTVLETQAQEHSNNEPGHLRIAAASGYFSAKMYGALLEADLTDEQKQKMMTFLESH